MPTKEEFKIKFGADASALERGQREILLKEQGLAGQLNQVWADAARKGQQDLQRIEIEGLKKRIAERVAMEKQAQAEIAAGSGGYSWRKTTGVAPGVKGEEHAGGVGGVIAATAATGGSARDMASAAGGMAAYSLGESAAKSAWNHTAKREFVVMIREGLRGAYSRMLSSFSIFFGAIASTASARIIGPVVAAFGGWEAGQWINKKFINEPEEKAQASENEAMHGLGGRLDKQIKKSLDSGRITRGQAARLQEMTKSGEYYKILAAQKFISKHMATGKEAEAGRAAAYEAETDQIREKAGMVQQSNAEQLNNLLLKRIELQNHIQYLNKQTMEYAKTDREIAEKTLQIEEKKKALKEETRQIQHQYYSISENIRSTSKSMSAIDRETPTIADLAGWKFSGALDKMYGRGGRFDLGAGDGPFAGIAQSYMLAQKQQMWDIIHGNAVFNSNGELVGGQAFADQRKALRLHNMLSGAGLETPAMKLTDMNRKLSDLNGQLKDLLTTAKHDGIIIKTDR